MPRIVNKMFSWSIWNQGCAWLPTFWVAMKNLRKKNVKITIWVIKLLSIESDSDCNQIRAIFIESMCNITLVQYKVSWQMAINMYLCNNYSRLSNSCRPTIIYNFNFFPSLRSYYIGYSYLVLKIGTWLQRFS